MVIGHLGNFSQYQVLTARNLFGSLKLLFYKWINLKNGMLQLSHLLNLATWFETIPTLFLQERILMMQRSSQIPHLSLLVCIACKCLYLDFQSSESSSVPYSIGLYLYLQTNFCVLSCFVCYIQN